MASKTKPITDDFVRMYYEHQYDRMKAIEGYRWSLTSVVVSLSVIAFTFGFQSQSGLTIINGLVLPLLIITLNLLAVLYVWRTYSYVLMHQRRAKAVLAQYAKELFNLDAEHPRPGGLLGLGISKFQITIHLLLLIPSLIPLVVYLLQ
jgi:hypothetical protein